MLQRHPNLQLGGSITLEPDQKPDESIGTYVLRYLSFVREENKKGRRYEDIEILERIYSKMLVKGFKHTRRAIELTIGKFYTTNNLPPGYCTQFLHSTLHQLYAREDGKKAKEKLRVNQLVEDADEHFIDATEELLDDSI